MPILCKIVNQSSEVVFISYPFLGIFVCEFGSLDQTLNVEKSKILNNKTSLYINGLAD